VNGSAGIGWKPIESWLFKANATSGYRTGNLAELASNGVHEGTLRFEIGDPNMKVEQNLCEDFSITYAHKGFRFDVSVWNNRFLNYIYLAPTNEDYFGFSVYRYTQANATLQGGEAGIDWNPQAIDWLDMTLTASTIRAHKDDGSYLPFIPSDRFEGNIKCELGDLKHARDWYVRGGAQYVPEQNRPAQFETSTPAYSLIDAGFGCSIPFSKNRAMQIDVCCNNLLDAKYYDHLSRYKAFGIYDMGRNICLNIYCPF
jgi:iron complex outermembrane receptor protein